MLWQVAFELARHYIFPIGRKNFGDWMVADSQAFLTAPEAAVVARVTVREVNRAIDERLLPDRLYALEDGRRVHVTACPFIGFYFHTANALTAEERGVLIRRLFERIGPQLADKPVRDWRKISRPSDWTVHEGFLTVSLWEFVTGVEDRYVELAEARDRVVEDPDILAGTPVIRGTRIPVHDVAASVASGCSFDRIRAAYPGLDDRTIELAAVYAQAVPARGRPRRVAFLAPDALIKSSNSTGT